jgi:hypothetical protein
MKFEYEVVDDSQLDIDDWEVERDMQLAAVDAIRRARRFGTMFVISHDKQIPPDQTGPYEERFLAEAERINRRIAELKAQDQNSMLNDRPVDKK